MGMRMAVCGLLSLRGFKGGTVKIEKRQGVCDVVQYGSAYDTVRKLGRNVIGCRRLVIYPIPTLQVRH